MHENRGHMPSFLFPLPEAIIHPCTGHSVQSTYSGSKRSATGTNLIELTVSGLQGNMPAHHMTAVVWREEERTEGRGEGGEGGREEGREGKSLRYIVERVLTDHPPAG